MKTLALTWFVLSGVVTSAAFAAQSLKASPREIIGRIPNEPDVVLEWNASISRHFEEVSFASTPHIAVRVYAMVHLAMRDAIVAANREAPRDAAGASANSAAGAAAHDMLAVLCPAGVNRFAALRDRQVAALANDGAAAHGRTIGQRMAASVLSSRAADGWPVAPSRLNAEGIGIDSLRMMGAKPIPFVLKRAQQFEPEPPYLDLNGGVLVPNRSLKNKKFIGTPADFAPAARTGELWRTEPIVQWNRAAHALALAQPQDLPERARLFSTLNTALADALLSATYWSDIYRNGREVAPDPLMLDAYHRARDTGEVGPDLDELWRRVQPLSGFPAVPAALGGAAEAVLRSSFGDAIIALPARAGGAGSETDFTSLRATARQCAWAEFMAGVSTHEGCVSGYELGGRIGAHLLKQQRR